MRIIKKCFDVDILPKTDILPDGERRIESRERRSC